MLGYILNSFGLALIVGVAFANVFVVQQLAAAAQQQVLAGPARLAFLISSLIFLVGSVLFGIALLKARVFSPIATVLYIIGFVLLSLFALLPPIVNTIGGVLAGIGVLWLGYELWSGKGEVAGQVKPAM